MTKFEMDVKSFTDIFINSLRNKEVIKELRSALSVDSLKNEISKLRSEINNLRKSCQEKDKMIDEL